MTENHHIFSEERVSLYKQIIEKQLTFAYVGDFNDSVNDVLIPIAENLIKKTSAPLVLRKRSFYIMIECIQNVNRHHSIIKNPGKMPKELFLVQGEEDLFSIASANVMDSKSVPSLNAKIEKLNNLSEFGLDIYYKTLLKETVLSLKGGAGLGLIEVARKSANKINYKFTKINEENTLFLMESFIQKHKSEEQPRQYYGLDFLEALNDFYKDYKFSLSLKGNCAMNTVEEINSMIQFLNNLNPAPFFRNHKLPVSLHKLMQLIPSGCFTQDEFLPKEMFFQFEQSEKLKLFNLGWILPSDYSQKCFTNFEKLFQSGQKASNDVSLLLNELKEGSGAKISSHIISGKQNEDLFIISIPVGNN